MKGPWPSAWDAPPGSYAYRDYNRCREISKAVFGHPGAFVSPMETEPEGALEREAFAIISEAFPRSGSVSTATLVDFVKEVLANEREEMGNYLLAKVGNESDGCDGSLDATISKALDHNKKRIRGHACDVYYDEVADFGDNDE